MHLNKVLTLKVEFAYMFHVKTKWNIFWEYWKNKFFKRQTSFPKCIEYTLFLDSQPPSLEGNAYHQTIPILALRKRYAHKTSGCGISTEEHMPKNKSFSPRTKVHSQNNYFSIQKIVWRKLKILQKICGLVSQYFIVDTTVFMTADILLFCLSILTQTGR